MTRTRIAAGLAIALGAGLAAWAGRLADVSPAHAMPLGYQVTFQLTQSQKSLGPSTSDQVMIVFANRSVEGPRPPRPFFGEDIVQEFSFSGADFVGNQLRFTRRVNDKSFLDARYIRVVNYGEDGWDGESITMTVDGQEILRNVRMSPRIGAEPAKGIQKFNPREWSSRTYWEADLSQFRKYSKY